MTERDEFRPSPAREARRERRAMSAFWLGMLVFQAFFAWQTPGRPWQHAVGFLVLVIGFGFLTLTQRLWHDPPVDAAGDATSRAERRARAGQAAWAMVTICFLAALVLFAVTFGWVGRVAFALGGLAWLWLVWRARRPSAPRA